MPEDSFQPVLLHKCTFNPSVANMAFVGIYRGPYFGVIELQARWASMVFSGEIPLPEGEKMLAGIDEERNIRAQKPRPQFPHGDYVGMGDHIAREIKAFPDEKNLPAGKESLINKIMSGPVIPAHYRMTGPHAKPEIASRQIEEVNKIYQQNQTWKKQALGYAVNTLTVGLGIYATYKKVTSVQNASSTAMKLY
jgi:dimethylaniline monooxygenase (N-oxide forming)